MSDYEAILSLLGKLANSFDLKSWEDLKTCLAGSIYTDYSALHGTPPTTLSAEDFVTLRRQALGSLHTHHLMANPEIQVDGGTGTVRVSMLIRRNDSSAKSFTTHCLYELGVEKQAGNWKIRAIKQNVLWNEGDPLIHKGVK
jgi:hypothetical protein